MKVRLTRAFYDNVRLWPAGSELELDTPPSSAINLDPPPAEPVVVAEPEIVPPAKK